MNARFWPKADILTLDQGPPPLPPVLDYRRGRNSAFSYTSSGISPKGE